MAPFVPYHISAGSSKIVSFGGLLETEFLEPPPGRGFCFRQTYRAPDDIQVAEDVQEVLRALSKPQGPPPHMHQYQAEYFKVEQGIMGVMIDGKRYKKTAQDPEFLIPAGTFHGFYRHQDSPGPMTVVLSASDSGRDFKLDRVFFENWYGYWHDALLYEGGMNTIQWLQIYDAGDAYPNVPSWVPFKRTVSYYTGVVIGRWLGGLLGYKPFYKEYTTDWDYAVEKMRNFPTFRRLVHTSYQAAMSWSEQVHASSGPKPTNAQYESYTTSILKSNREAGPLPAKVNRVSVSPVSGNGELVYTNGNGRIGH